MTPQYRIEQYLNAINAAYLGDSPLPEYPAEPVRKGELAQGAQNGVGQPSLDGFTHPRQAAIQEFLVRTAVPTALKLGGAVLRPFIQTSRGE